MQSIILTLFWEPFNSFILSQSVKSKSSLYKLKLQRENYYGKRLFLFFWAEKRPYLKQKFNGPIFSEKFWKCCFTFFIKWIPSKDNNSKVEKEGNNANKKAIIDTILLLGSYNDSTEICSSTFS